MMENHLSCAPCSRAWAAGFFDAEGSAVLREDKRRHSYRGELYAYQDGREPPAVLLRLRQIFACGVVEGPSRGRSWCWRAGRRDDIIRAAGLLWPWLGPVKRAQILTMAAAVARLEGIRELESGGFAEIVSCRRGRLDLSALAWAGGFFVGEGTIRCTRVTKATPWSQVVASIPQASSNGAPVVLERFRAAVLGLGAIQGPYPPNNRWSRLPQYRWSVSSFEAAQAVIALLWVWLDAEKREQASSALLAMRDYRLRVHGPIARRARG